MDLATPAALYTLALTTLRQVPRETAASSLRLRSNTPASRGYSPWATRGASVRAFLANTGVTCGSLLLGRLMRDDEQLARAMTCHERQYMRLATLPAQTASSTANAHQRSHVTWQKGGGYCLWVARASYLPRLQPLQLRSALTALTWLPLGSAHLFGGQRQRSCQTLGTCCSSA